MKISVPSAAIAMLAAFSLPATASAETARCVNADQVGSLATAVLPGMITKLSQSCAKVLPEGASLRVSGASAEEQFRDAAIAARPKALEAIKLIAGEDGAALPEGMSADVIFPFMEVMLFAELEKANLEKTCPVANNLWSAMKSLPFENWGYVLAAIVSAEQAGDGKADTAPKKPAKRRSMTADLPICPYVAMES